MSTLLMFDLDHVTLLNVGFALIDVFVFKSKIA